MLLMRKILKSQITPCVLRIPSTKTKSDELVNTKKATLQSCRPQYVGYDFQIKEMKKGPSGET